MTCSRCGYPMTVIAFIEEPEPIHGILWLLGLPEFPVRSPPPRLFPHKLQALLATLTPRQAQQLRASTDSLFWDDVPIHSD